MQPHDDPLSRFNGFAGAAIAADELARRNLIFPGGLADQLSRRALNVARDVLRPPSAIVLRPQPRHPAGSGSPAGDVWPDAPPLPPSSEAEPSRLTLREAREQWEREWLTDRLRDHHGNVAATAVAIGMDRSALIRKLRQLGVQIGPIRAETSPTESPHA